MKTEHKAGGFALLEVLVALLIVALLVSFGQNVRLGNLTSYSDKSLSERNQQLVRNAVWRMAIAQDRPVEDVGLLACGSQKVLVGAGGIVQQTKISCKWGEVSIDKAGNFTYASE
ncbi:prepilin-type N-terminal cleavage/methylation domain-containing protein [Alphaproteobacteria bacterium LSUCC0684]